MAHEIRGTNILGHHVHLKSPYIIEIPIGTKSGIITLDFNRVYISYVFSFDFKDVRATKKAISHIKAVNFYNGLSI